MKRKKGVTILELVVVMAVTAILLLVAIPAISNITNKAKLNAIKDSLVTISNTCPLEEGECIEETKFSDLEVSDVPKDIDLDKSTVRYVEVTEEDGGEVVSANYVFNVYYKDETFPVVHYRTLDYVKSAKKLEELGMNDDEKFNSFDFDEFILDVAEVCSLNGQAARCRAGYNLDDLEYINDSGIGDRQIDFDVPEEIDGSRSYIFVLHGNYYFDFYYKNEHKPMIAFYSLTEVLNTDNHEDLREKSKNYDINRMVNQLIMTCTFADEENFDYHSSSGHHQIFWDCYDSQTLDRAVFNNDYDSSNITPVNGSFAQYYEYWKFYSVDFIDKIDKSASSIRRNRIHGVGKFYVTIVVDGVTIIDDVWTEDLIRKDINY